MKALIVEDDFTSRILLDDFLRQYGPVDVAVDGREAVSLVQSALDAGEPYDLICLDIMLPVMDGHEVLKVVRSLEESKPIVRQGERFRSKVVMATALDDVKNVLAAFSGLCDGYLVKPIVKSEMRNELVKLGLIG